MTADEVTFPADGFVIDRFASKTSDGWYEEQPPFDHVLTFVDGREALFRLADLRLTLVPFDD